MYPKEAKGTVFIGRIPSSLFPLPIGFLTNAWGNHLEGMGCLLKSGLTAAGFLYYTLS